MLFISQMMFSSSTRGAFTGGGNSQARFDEALGQLEVDLDGDGTLDIAAPMGSVSLAGQLTAGDFVFN